MFPNLAARETCVAETNFAARKQEMFLPWSQKHFCFPDTNFASEHMFPSLATPGNIQRNIVSATMFPSLARPLSEFFDVTFLCRVVTISACAQSHPASIALRYVQRRVLMSDPNWNNGFYYDGRYPRLGMKHAR